MFKGNLEILFIDELTNGINLFLGSGFSLLPDRMGNTFPTAIGLCEEVCEKFTVNEIFIGDLYAASEMVPKIEYQNFLRDRFKNKNGINEKYKLLDKLHLKSIITTNIDDIVPCVFAGEDALHCLNDRSVYGTVRKDEFSIDYIALNGSVSIDNSHLYFGRFELSVVEQKNKDLFDIAQVRLTEAPVLFWGYSFGDTGVRRMVKTLLDSNKHANIWVQCIEDDKQQIAFFENLGCKIIIADTNKMFDWINDKYLPNISETQKDKKDDLERKEKSYRVPKRFSRETNSKEDYYRFGLTHWYSIFNNHPYETSLVDQLWALSLQHNNVIVLGDSFSGKTTALMQCAAKRDNATTFYFYGDITKEQVANFLKNIGNKKIIVFLQDFHKDVEAFCCFAESANVRLIATADRYIFESVKHIILRKEIKYFAKRVGSIDENTARLIYNHMPDTPTLKRSNFTYRENKNEEYSFLEFLGQNVKGFATRESVKKILRKICVFNDKGFPCNEIRLVVLTVYLEVHNSLMSTDLFFSFFGFNDYFGQIKPLTDSVAGMLKDAADISADQDYFSIRSKFFLKYAKEIFSTDDILRQVYCDIVYDFVECVPKRNVFRYDVFRRKAYDSLLFYKLFYDENLECNEEVQGEKAIELYDILYRQDESPYTLQQKALCLSLLRRSKEAFAAIDEALEGLPFNFSIKNSKAEIIFNANKSFNTEHAFSQLIKAVEILDECRKNDKRQNYHAILYAKIALHLNDNFSCPKYLGQAEEWLSTIETGIDNKVDKLLQEIDQKNDAELCAMI